jgi:hypothetical protein
LLQDGRIRRGLCRDAPQYPARDRRVGDVHLSSANGRAGGKMTPDTGIEHCG